MTPTRKLALIALGVGAAAGGVITAVLLATGAVSSPSEKPSDFCARHPSNPNCQVGTTTTSTTTTPPSGNVYFTGDFETGNISQWTWGAQCANYGFQGESGIARGNFYTDTSIVGQGVYSGRFELPANTSIRQACEVIRKRNSGVGTDEYYGLMFRLPSNWVEPSSASWGLLITQFNYQGIWGPSLGLNLHAARADCVTQTGYTLDGSGAQYVNTVPCIPTGRLDPGVWHKLIVHVKWRTDSTGLIEVWHQRKGIDSGWLKTMTLSGYPTMQWNDSAHGTPIERLDDADYFTSDKIGGYRGPSSDPLSVWHDGFVIGTTFDSVANRLP